MRISAAVIGASRLRRSAAMTVAVRPRGSRVSNGSKIGHIWPEFVAGLNEMPSMPEYTETDDTPGVPSTTGRICCTTASERARLAPGGNVTDSETLFWSCDGTKPRGVSITRQIVNPTRPA